MAGTNVRMAADAATGADGSPQWRMTMWAMVMVQLVMSTSFSFLSPIMPLFLPEIGVQSASAVDLWSGVLASITSFIAVFTSPMWGRMADRYGRKLMVLRSSLGISVFTILMGLAGSIWQLLALRVLMGAFAGFSAASVVMVASQVPEGRLGYALGLLSTGQLVGSLMGPLLGGGLADLTGSYRIPFYIAGAIGLAAFALCWAVVPESFTPPKEQRQKTSLVASFRLITRSSSLSALVLVLLLTQFATQAIQPVITLFVQELVGPEANLGTLGGIAFSATGLAGVFAVPLLGRSIDRIGERRVLLIAIAGAALLTAPQAIVSGYWGFVLERFGVGLFVGGIIPAANALIGRLTAATDRGFIYGTTASAYFLGNALGPLTGGAVGAVVGLRWVFVVTAVLLFATLAWVYVAVPKRAVPAA
jgi:DHA1 family multidrug resistance protein-like MFS transporter